MKDSITREELAEYLVRKSFSVVFSQKIMNGLFPPKFVPKPGEVVAVWDDDDPSSHVFYKKFIVMTVGGYYTAGDSDEDWDNCRALTDKERGVK